MCDNSNAVNASRDKRELCVPIAHSEYALRVEVVFKPVNVERVEDLVKARVSESADTCEQHKPMSLVRPQSAEVRQGVCICPRTY